MQCAALEFGDRRVPQCCPKAQRRGVARCWNQSKRDGFAELFEELKREPFICFVPCFPPPRRTHVDADFPSSPYRGPEVDDPVLTGESTTGSPVPYLDPQREPSGLVSGWASGQQLRRELI